MEKDTKEIKPSMRQIIIETDGTNVVIKKAEVSGIIEFNGILKMLINYLNEPKKTPNTTKSVPVETPKKEETLPESEVEKVI